MSRYRSFVCWLLVLLGASSSEAQTALTWRWSNPQPHGGNIFGMAYGSGVTVQVAERGQIYVSEDLQTWQIKDSGVTNTLLGAAFLGQRLVVCGENGLILYGDTLEDFASVSLGTTDWMEDVAASDSLVVTVGDNGSIYTSPDAATWTKQSISGNPTNWLRGVTCGNNAFVAVGEGGFIAVANMTGTTWTKKTSGTTQNLNRVYYDGSQYWIVGENGTLLTSANNGNTWSAFSPSFATTNSLNAISTGSNTVLVAGSSEFRFKDTTGNFTNQLLSSTVTPPPNWTYYTSLWEDSLHFTAGRSGMMVQGYPTNTTPYQWLTPYDSIRNWLWDLTVCTNVAVAVGDLATVMTSSDGVNWNLELVPNSLTNAVFLGVGGDNRGLVAVGNKGAVMFSTNQLVSVTLTNSDGTVITSSASSVGVTWVATSARLTTNDLQGVTAYPSGFVTVGGNGVIFTSSDGLHWSQRTSPTTKFLSGVTAFPGGLVATGDKGTILSSTDGVTWTTRTSGTTNWLFRVRWLNGQLMAVGENGTILTSADGVTWSSQVSGTTKWLNHVDYQFGQYYAVGNQGAVLTSSDATNWTYLGTITQKSLYGITGLQGRLLVAGVEGAILRSPVQPDQTPVRFLNFSQSMGQNVYLVSGKTDQRFTIQRGTDLTTWTNGVTFEIQDPSGTVLVLESSNSNVLPQEYLRAVLSP